MISNFLLNKNFSFIQGPTKLEFLDMDTENLH